MTRYFFIQDGTMRKFHSPVELFEKYAKVEKQRHHSDSYRINGFLAVRGGSLAINKYIVENQPGYAELVKIIKEVTNVKNPEVKVCDHIRNLRYNSSEDIAPQWGLMDVLKVKTYDEIPPCIIVTVDGEDRSLMNDETPDATILLKKAEKIRSPLLEELSSLAEK